MTALSRAFRELADWVYPPRCGLCGALAEPPICESCRAEFRPLLQRFRPHLRDSRLGWSAALFAFDGRAAQAVKRLKYERVTSLADPMSALMSTAPSELGLPDVDAVVPVPIHWSRACGRGFNQSTLLCQGFDRALVRPELLRRIRSTRPQVGLSPAQRLTNLLGAFEAPSEVRGLRVMLVDDVTTSGGTGVACATALRERGCASVGLLAFCGVGEPDPALS